MTTDQVLTAQQSLGRAQRRRLLWRMAIRSAAGMVVLVAFYYQAPMQDLRGVPVWASLSVGLVVLFAVIVLQVRAITHSRYPGLRAVEALALTAPLFLVMFAAAYVILSQDDPANFSTPALTRTDALYFTLTIFSTVGFGDITARSQSARVFVMVQMVLDFVILYLVVQVFRGAVKAGRNRSESVTAGQPAGPGESDEPDQTAGTRP